MKVLNLRCSHGHGFEGWFDSEEDFQGQLARGLVGCPLCTDKSVTKLPSAPRLNISHRIDERAAPAGPSAAAPAAGGLQSLWMQAVRQVFASTEDVGEQFAEEARRIHYGEAKERNIRGRASREETEALLEEGIDVMALPIPDSLKGTLQ